MIINPLILLIIYLAGAFVFLILSFLNIYHIIRFGFSRRLGAAVTVIYIGLSLAVFLITFQLLSGVDWRAPLALDLPFTQSVDDGY